MLISTYRENSADPSDPLVGSFPGIPSDFVGWSDPLSDLFSWEDKKFCCIVYIDEPSKYSIVESKRLLDVDEHGYGSIKEFGKTYSAHLE